jgi:hypothetical protein
MYTLNIGVARCDNIVELKTQDDWVGIELCDASY